MSKPDWHNWLTPEERKEVDYHTGAWAALKANIDGHRQALKPYKARADMRKLRGNMPEGKK